MRNIRQGKQSVVNRIWNIINDSLFKLNLLLTFLGILPLIVFIYYNLVHFHCIRSLTGCFVLITMIKANKEIQGG